MPTRPMRPCKQPGCPATVSAGYCPRHERTAYSSPTNQRKRADAQKGEGRQFYSSPAWRRVRSVALTLSPVCPCGEPADTVDHILPRRDRPDLALTLANLRTLCARCHNRHTATSGGGFGNRRQVA